MKDKIVEKVIFKYLDKQNYNQIKIGYRIYFVKNVGDKYADIRFNKSDGWCYVHYDLMSFFSRMMGVEHSDIQDVIGSWLEQTLQMKVKYSSDRDIQWSFMLNIPTNEGERHPLGSF